MSTPADSQPRDNAAAPRIIVDTDWKAQAQAEKERLAAQTKQAGSTSSAAGTGPAGGAEASPFLALVASLATQALLYLGGVADPQTGKAVVAPDHARAFIDMLATLEEKTKGNLTKEEEEELQGVLNELRMRFVQIVG
ncbi:MAG: DUF1844 domain-containing protein, partial [Planctomycetota bacterium]